MNAVEEGVILLFKGDTTQTPIAMVRRNGHIEYFNISSMNWEDHRELLGANKVNTHEKD